MKRASSANENKNHLNIGLKRLRRLSPQCTISAPSPETVLASTKIGADFLRSLSTHHGWRRSVETTDADCDDFIDIGDENIELNRDKLQNHQPHLPRHFDRHDVSMPRLLSSPCGYASLEEERVTIFNDPSYSSMATNFVLRVWGWGGWKWTYFISMKSSLSSSHSQNQQTQQHQQQEFSEYKHPNYFFEVKGPKMEGAENGCCGGRREVHGFFPSKRGVSGSKPRLTGVEIGSNTGESISTRGRDGDWIWHGAGRSRFRFIDHYHVHSNTQPNPHPLNHNNHFCSNGSSQISGSGTIASYEGGIEMGRECEFSHLSCSDPRSRLMLSNLLDALIQLPIKWGADVLRCKKEQLPNVGPSITGAARVVSDCGNDDVNACMEEDATTAIQDTNDDCNFTRNIGGTMRLGFPYETRRFDVGYVRPSLPPSERICHNFLQRQHQQEQQEQQHCEEDTDYSMGMVLG